MLQAWGKLRPGGHLLINMTNYGYWLKSLANRVRGAEHFKHEHEHFCVHSAESLPTEILGIVPGAKLIHLDSDYRHLPNLPRKLSFLYFHALWIDIANLLARTLVVDICRIRNRGAVMIAVFQKP